MYVCVLWIVFLNWIATTGQAFSDIESCITTTDRESSMSEQEYYCLASKDNVNLACSPSKIAIISSIRFGLKSNIDICTKRIISPDDLFCCKQKKNDEVYDGDCLRDIWSNEDVQHYDQFIQYATVKCKETRKCVLESTMFSSLQKEIPTSRMYSSYMEISYHCISGLTNSINFCSKKTITGKEVHLLSGSRTDNQTCTCRLRSSKRNSRVTVRAVDVRTTKSGLIVQSEYNKKDLSYRQRPLNGFREIATGHNIQVSARGGDARSGDETWLHISGSDGQTVDVVCEGPVSDAPTKTQDTTTRAKSLTPPTSRVSKSKKQKKSEGYWPVIYLAAGSGITLVLIACIIGSLLICRCSLKKTKPRYENPYNQSQVNYNRSGQYDTVPGGMPNIPDAMTTSIQDPYEWPHAFVK